MSEKKYIPDEFVNRIAYRVPRRSSILVSSPMEVGFDTWDAAHAELVGMRYRAMLDQQKSVDRAVGRYRFAQKMKQKPAPPEDKTNV